GDHSGRNREEQGAAGGGGWAPHLLADVLVPDLRVPRDEPLEQVDALLRVEVDHLDPVLAEPLDPALEGARLPDHDRPDAELADQPAAVPARRERGGDRDIAIGTAATGVAERLGLAV